VESSHRYCALMIGLVGISKRRLGHSQPHDHGSVGAPDQDVRSNENGGLGSVPLDVR
jgi:hypothetical protein